MFKNNRNLLIIALIALINALGYGIIIPILYSYSQKFGLSDFANGLLFSLFSICQFASTPVIGRLSDKYGRRPLLITSLIGTALSFVMMAFAPSALFLFLARALDGLTAGNIPVAMAVISDTTKPQDRAKGFGIIGAAFGFGFVAGPAISALTVGVNPAIPFLIAAAITIVAVILTAFLLPETNQHMGEIRNTKLFDFKKLFDALKNESISNTLVVSLIYSLAFGLLIYAYQPFSVKLLNLSPTQISINFAIFGLVGLVSQLFIIPKTINRIADKKLLFNALALSIFAFLGLFVSRSYFIFVLFSIFVSLSNAFVNPLIQSLLSKETDEKSQGEIMGVNSSYMSIGTIFGPIIGGTLAGISIPMPFLGGSFLALIATYFGYQILRKSTKVVSLE